MAQIGRTFSGTASATPELCTINGGSCVTIYVSNNESPGGTSLLVLVPAVLGPDTWDVVQAGKTREYTSPMSLIGSFTVKTLAATVAWTGGVITGDVQS